MNAHEELLEVSYLDKSKIDNVISFDQLPNSQFNFQDTEDYEQNYSRQTRLIKINELATIYNIDEKKLVRKIDLCVVPPFALLYFLAYFNRSSFGFIEGAGIFEDLHLTSLQFYSSYAAFFAPYILFQFFSNLLLKRVRPHFWISISVLLYGVVTLSSGFVHSYGAYVGLHFLHGVVQAGSETAIFYILAHYYTPHESQRRFSSIYSVSCIAGIISSFIAYGITKNLDGNNGWPVWRWAVITYGSLTMGCAVILFFILPDFPEGARFFNDDETFFLIKKLELFGGKSGYSLDSTKEDIFKCLVDPLVWLPAFCSLGISYATYVYAFHEPIFMDAIGYPGAKNISFGNFPWVVAFIWCNASGFVSEYIGKRSPVIIANLIIALVGSLLIFIPSQTENHIKYIGSFFLAAGGYSALPVILCWTTLNVGGHLRKSIITSLQISFGSIGGIISIFTFYKHEKDVTAPFAACFGFQLLTLIAVVAYLFVCLSNNKEKRTNNYKEQFSEKSERDKIIFNDKRPSFDYML